MRKILDGCICWHGIKTGILFVHFVDDEKDSVTAIYRKINKDYICIWEKEGNT